MGIDDVEPLGDSRDTWHRSAPEARSGVLGKPAGRLARLGEDLHFAAEAPELVGQLELHPRRPRVPRLHHVHHHEDPHCE
jgi:hypothetical protein